MRADTTGRGGLTLIELLVVVSIIILLVGMLTPMLGMARRTAARTNTFALLQKVSGGLNQFRTDVGGHPFLAWDLAANPPPTADATPPVNQLAFHLCRNLTQTELADLRADANTVGNAFENGGWAAISSADFNMRRNTVWGGGSSTGYQHVNRAAKQWATSNIMVGNTRVGKPSKNGTEAWIYGAALLASPRSRGWAGDYLSRDIPPKNRSGDAILDMWGTPLVYLCPVQPGIIGYYGEGLGNQYLDTGWFGLAPRSFRTETGVLDSDLRDSAAADYVFTPEVWSAGPDKSLSSHRTDLVNRDNIPALNYHKVLR